MRFTFVATTLLCLSGPVTGTPIGGPLETDPLRIAGAVNGIETNHEEFNQTFPELTLAREPGFSIFSGAARPGYAPDDVSPQDDDPQPQIEALLKSGLDPDQIAPVVTATLGRIVSGTGIKASESSSITLMLGGFTFLYIVGLARPRKRSAAARQRKKPRQRIKDEQRMLA